MINLSDNRVNSKFNTHNMVRIFTKLNKGLNIVHINAQSLLCKIDEFRYIFESSNVDIICVSETWFIPKVKDNCYSLRGYKLFRNDRNSGKKQVV